MFLNMLNNIIIFLKKINDIKKVDVEILNICAIRRLLVFMHSL